jgi:hypothetical protein
VDSKDVWQTFQIPDGFFDFIFIDGNHTKDGVTLDITNNFRKLKIGGAIAGHDFTFDSVREAVQEYFGNDFDFVDNIWIRRRKPMENKIVLLSCWAKPLRNNGMNAKNPEQNWWINVIKLLKEKGYTVWQCGQGQEIKLDLADKHLWNKDLWDLGEDIMTVDAWISVDNFFPHWALLQFEKPGIVIWGQSDPEIFGHKGNVNMLKDRKYLREKQYEVWEAATHNQEAFVSPEEVVVQVVNFINSDYSPA